jgi:hypothetical protein
MLRHSSEGNERQSQTETKMTLNRSTTSTASLTAIGDVGDTQPSRHGAARLRGRLEDALRGWRERIGNATSGRLAGHPRTIDIPSPRTNPRSTTGGFRADAARDPGSLGSISGTSSLGSISGTSTPLSTLANRVQELGNIVARCESELGRLEAEFVLSTHVREGELHNHMMRLSVGISRRY